MSSPQGGPVFARLKQITLDVEAPQSFRPTAYRTTGLLDFLTSNLSLTLEFIPQLCESDPGFLPDGCEGLTARDMRDGLLLSRFWTELAVYFHPSVPVRCAWGATVKAGVLVANLSCRELSVNCLPCGVFVMWTAKEAPGYSASRPNFTATRNL